MRLTRIKLAGFKSFVDPTTIPVPGQLVGVVGPNGCGKSNVIDAVRWVLGESKASALRGESMQDVIFAGSSTRKAVSRASVELVFDNSLGRAAGQWSNYAEISVKRVLQRDGESSYYINNLHVRRRDITDMFLGTGLGARAYAIIEQGMISRIIEAKPEELRVFLEEAAGISKYKERRKETESRLADTRENLQRVDDIRQELAKQLQHLEVQAQVAARYQTLQAELHTTQNLLWMLKRRDAAVLRDRLAKDVARLTNELEAELSKLREAEKHLEEMRAAHYSAGDILHQAQGELYEANSEVAKLEQQVQHQRETRERMEQQVSLQKRQLDQTMQNLDGARTALEQARGELESLQERVSESRHRAAEQRDLLPPAEEVVRALQQHLGDVQRTLSQSEQAWQIEETHRNHAIRTIQQLQARQQRLQQELHGLPEPDQEALVQGREELAVTEQELEEARLRLEELQAQLAAAENLKKEVDGRVLAAGQELTRLEAQLNALEHLQNRIEQNKGLREWLEKHDLSALPRLWQRIDLEAGWETAVESVLGERLNALELQTLESAERWLDDAPPGVVVAFDGSRTDIFPDGQARAGFVRLLDKVRWRGAPVAPLASWLGGVYCAENCADAISRLAHLKAGERLVCPDGHLFGPGEVTFYAPKSELHGVLGRQREIDQIRTQLAERSALLPALKAQQHQADQRLEQIKSEGARWRVILGEAQQRQHRQQMELLKLSQIAERVGQRREQLAQELDELATSVASEVEQRESAEYTQREYRAQIEALRENIEDLRQEYGVAEAALAQHRQTLNSVEREVHEAEYAERSIISKISDLENNIKNYVEIVESVRERLEMLEEERASLDDEPLRERLQQALNLRKEREESLTRARDALAGLTASLAEMEKERLGAEQRLHPLRESIGEVRLKEQEARLTEEQLTEQLRASDADFADLEQRLEKNAKAGALSAEINRLNGEIADLGAVNLAALEELQQGRERENYLHAQASDLGEAIDTLESAIRRIDRETREKLQNTFDIVNGHLGQMFPTLFGGGQAKLVLTGEEILDAGIQVIAQPPGKKNSSIHLLSGGEKALTALSLVFSLFQLNPAPFCLLDEVDAPLDDANTGRFCELVRKMSEHTQFLFISHNKVTMEMANQLVGITMQELGVSRVVAVDIEEALRLAEDAVA